MGKLPFRFEDEQRNRLLSCWKRPRDCKIAALYLQEAERLIAHWQVKNNRNPPTTIKEQIALADDLRINVERNPALLEQLPQDFEALLSTIWLHLKYGEDYFQQHSEACRKDAANNTVSSVMIDAVIRCFAPDGAPTPAPIESEFSKLPPNYFQQDKSDADFLRLVANAAGEIAWMLRGARSWHNKSAEEELVFLLALSYKHHFGKLPSAGNAGKEGLASPFRSFVAELSNMLECKLGACKIRDVLGALKKHCS